MDKTEKKVIEAYEKADDKLIRLSTGVMLKAKPVSPLAIVKTIVAFPRPKPPVVFMEAMGRDMENPDDPDYISRVSSWEAEQGIAMLNVAILYGTEVVSVPKGFPKHTEDIWLNDLRALGIAVNERNDSWRYLNWVMLKAVASKNDLNLIQELVNRESGVTEEDVAAATTFPRSN